VLTMREILSESVRSRRFQAQLVAVFATAALLLACLGVYGVISYSVARRTGEIGIRIALGATPRAVLQAIAREGLWLGIAGLTIGIPCTLASGRFVRSMLHGLAANDPLTIAIASIAFLAVSAAAGLLPAYRASTIDPMAALRQD